MPRRAIRIELFLIALGLLAIEAIALAVLDESAAACLGMWQRRGLRRQQDERPVKWMHTKGPTGPRLRKRVNKGGLGNRRAADARAEAMLPTIRELDSAGVVLVTAIRDELNRRSVPTPRAGKKWH